MNPIVFELSSYTAKAFSEFSRSRIQIQDVKNIPEGSVIFCANHFTRIETLFLPYHIHAITKKQVWSLAARELFERPLLKGLLGQFGAVSTRDPHRDDLILKTLLPGKAQWIIFPEGMMVKNKKLVKNNRFYLRDDSRLLLRPRTGAAISALACEFFRQRLARLRYMDVPEYARLKQSLDIEDMDKVLALSTYIVPVNITYYPARPQENIIGAMTERLLNHPSKRVRDELMTESGILFSNVDITIRFGVPIDIRPYLKNFYLESMLSSTRRVPFLEDIYSRQITRKMAGNIMAQYMDSVYAMVTLNYDHIMACILKHFPYRKEGVLPYEFACKVFLAIRRLQRSVGVYLSDLFSYNQIHLLIDDRYNRINDFLDLAEKTGVVIQNQDRFIIDHARFSTLSEFHAVRMENPILVMANEVEPVREVENCIRTIARLSEKDTGKAVQKAVLEKINIDFTRDYAAHYSEGESKKKRIGRPLILKHDPDGAGVLLIHGYMAAPEEMKSFAHFLHQKGFTVVVPRLKGHGTSPKDLAATTYEEWMESVEEGYALLRHSCSQLFIGGFSTGAGLAIELACRVQDHRAVFAVAPPMRLNDLGVYFVPAIDTWNIMIKKIRIPSIAKEFIQNTPENPHINYLRNPIAGIRELERLMEQLGPKLKSLKTPVLVVQSRKDPVVSDKGTEKLFRMIGSAFKEYYLFDFDRHGILNGPGSERVFQAILGFILHWQGKPKKERHGAENDDKVKRERSR